MADEREAAVRTDDATRENARKILAEDKERRDKAKEKPKGKPTPTQEENDLAKLGAHTHEKQPDGSPLDGEALDAHTTAWAEAVNRSGAAYLTPAVVDGRWLARVSVGALATEAADVDAVWTAMRAAAEA